MTVYSDNLLSSIFPAVKNNPEYFEDKYDPRNLPADALVTRFGPSPTGFLHIGGVYTAMISKDLAKQTGGVYFIRIEDTDKKREIASASDHFDKSFQYFDIVPLEDDANGCYGPYKQSARSEIYLTYIKYLMKIARAYPCFCSENELEEKSKQQRDNKVDTGYYGPWATCKDLSAEEVEDRIKKGQDYVIRFRCNGKPGFENFTDAVRGNSKVKQNINDVVILKSSANNLPLPTYHFAHAVDDHLMRVNLVVRGEEWLSSVPLHLQLFDALGFERIQYAHIAPLMKLDGKSRRKLSKRKDPEASVDYYLEKGFPAKAVIAFLKGLANSRLADGNVLDSAEAPINLSDCQVSGPLVDMVKLKDVSSNYVAELTAEQIYELVIQWASEYDEPLYQLLKNQKAFTLQVINADRFSNGRVRKDLAMWSEFKDVYGFFYKDIFKTPARQDLENSIDVPVDVITAFLKKYISEYKDFASHELWFEHLKKIASDNGFAINKTELRENPDTYFGTMREASEILRVLITGRNNSPSLYDVCKVLGREEVLSRLKAFIS